MRVNLNHFERFENRHNSATEVEVSEMLNVIGVQSLDQLIDQTIPAAIRTDKPLNIPQGQSEYRFLKAFRGLASKNQIFRSYIGMGYYNCLTPSVILRNILENPGWYTAYTPYQAEIAQGRLEMLLNFQTVVTDLTGMEIANASLLDEGTAAAEAMAMLHAVREKKTKKTAYKFFIDKNLHPQTIDLLQTRAIPLGFELIIGTIDTLDLSDEDLFGVIVQQFDTNGEIVDFSNFTAAAHEQGVKVAIATDLLGLMLFKSPGDMGADVVVGSAQRFGVPMGYGGPHAGFFATKDAYKRSVPGRIIGVSKDKDGDVAYRMALQTREQHIKREKATSNICTAQVLLSVMAAAYAIYNGADGLKIIALRVHGLAFYLKQNLTDLGLEISTKEFFDTIKINVSIEEAKKIQEQALGRKMNFRYFEEGAISISINETTVLTDVQEIIEVFATALGKPFKVEASVEIDLALNEALLRKDEVLTHPVFSKYKSEHEMLRYLKRLENKDLSLVHSMISLGSCTMKLNATSEMIPVTWPEFGMIHPFAPRDQAQGYTQMFEELEAWLADITGFDAVSLQPNSGAQGEYAGLMAIRAYHESRGDHHRNIALIPSSAHGTNPASAVMAGMKVVVVKCDEMGNIDLQDLEEKAALHKDNLSALLVTYPSTHGVFEEAIRDICALIHNNGGKVYMDGANMNAQVGLTSPGLIGADVCHLNLHKTFCIPHGGGGPGMGPIGVNKSLAPFLPGHAVVEGVGGDQAISSVSSAPFGSASILAISYAYIRMMGGDGLTQATKRAIMNANYIKAKLEAHYPILYSGKNGRVAHEMIVDCRAFKAFGVEVEDISKRLMDYGYHSPTVSFPVAGTLMIEPTESESQAELDRFCDAMISIRKEVQEVENGAVDAVNNVLKNAPHTAKLALAEEWNLPYSREKAVFPLPYIKENKFWPSVRRIDSAFGDRNLVCSCLPMEDFEEVS